MRSATRAAACLLVVVAAASCSEDKPATDAAVQIDGKPTDAGVDGKTPDAPPDAQAFVVEVTCPNGNPKTVVTDGNAYDPVATTITQNGIVMFQMPASHDVRPSSSSPSDPGLRVLFGETKCLQFKATGTFNFFCGPHGFTGSITVN